MNVGKLDKNRFELFLRPSSAYYGMRVRVRVRVRVRIRIECLLWYEWGVR